MLPVALRVNEPAMQGDWDPPEDVFATLGPLLASDVTTFLAWSAANARAGDAPYTIDLEGAPYSQEPQKYAAKAFAALCAHFAAVRTNDLDARLGAEAVAILAQ
jgi:hypothetical protein